VSSVVKRIQRNSEISHRSISSSTLPRDPGGSVIPSIVDSVGAMSAMLAASWWIPGLMAEPNQSSGTWAS
jgi:hypothetical protein